MWGFPDVFGGFIMALLVSRLYAHTQTLSCRYLSSSVKFQTGLNRSSFTFKVLHSKLAFLKNTGDSWTTLDRSSDLWTDPDPGLALQLQYLCCQTVTADRKRSWSRGSCTRLLAPPLRWHRRCWPEALRPGHLTCGRPTNTTPVLVKEETVHSQPKVDKYNQWL